MVDKNKKALVVCTEKRGVFFGYGEVTDGSVRLEEAQMCVYWDAGTHGVLGLASQGPGNGCRVSPPVPAITLHGITAIMEASEQAEGAWKKQPWS